MFLTKFEDYPWFARQLAMNWAASRHYRYRFGDEYHRMSHVLDETRVASQEIQDAWQLERLAALLASSRSGCVYYASKLSDTAALVPGDNLDAALTKIPVLEKSVLRERTSEFVNHNVSLKLTTSTSGSTGSPMAVGQDANSAQRRFAFLDDHLRLAGVTRQQPSVRLSGRVICQVGKVHARPWLHNGKENVLFLSSYHLDDKHGAAICKKLEDLQPVLIDGYPSGILETLRQASCFGGMPRSLRAIITTAETLYPDIREELESLSQVPVMDYYGASEGVPYIHQCPKGTYHVRWQSGIFEVDDGVSIGREGDGELICTSFVQDRTPLIRYRTGDLVTGLRLSPPVPCLCGLLTPTVDSIQGRVEDLVFTTDGRALGMFTYRTLKYIKGLGDTQVIQHEFDRFEVRSVINKKDDKLPLKQAVGDSFERVLGYPVQIDFQRVEQLEKSKNGKVRLVISNVKRPGGQA